MLDDFDEVTDPYIPEIPEPDPIVRPTVDKILYGDCWAKGYRDGKVVIQLVGVSDINAIELYDDDGYRVTPEPAPSETKQGEQFTDDEVDWVKGLIAGVGGLDNE